MQDDILLQQIRANPDCGLKQLIELYGGLICTVIRGQWNGTSFCNADVEGCAADTFSEFYCDLDKYTPETGSIKAWLCSIARHNALDRRRRHRELPSVSQEEADDFSLEGDFERKETRERLLQAIYDLPHPDREILIRKFYLGQSSKEIGARLGLSVSNVDTRTHRAVNVLRQKLRGDTE